MRDSGLADSMYQPVHYLQDLDAELLDLNEDTGLEEVASISGLIRECCLLPARISPIRVSRW